MTVTFELHPLLEADTIHIGELRLSSVLLMDDSRYPWVVLVPRQVGVTELHELIASERVRLLEESCAVAKLLQRLFQPSKINHGALGNVVSQLHWHVIARSKKDPAWPGPVWGHSAALPYDNEAKQQMVEMLQSGLNDIGLDINR